MNTLDSRFRENDENGARRTFYEIIKIDLKNFPQITHNVWNRQSGCVKVDVLYTFGRGEGRSVEFLSC